MLILYSNSQVNTTWGERETGRKGGSEEKRESKQEKKKQMI